MTPGLTSAAQQRRLRLRRAHRHLRELRARCLIQQARLHKLLDMPRPEEHDTLVVAQHAVDWTAPAEIPQCGPVLRVAHQGNKVLQCKLLVYVRMVGEQLHNLLEQDPRAATRASRRARGQRRQKISAGEPAVLVAVQGLEERGPSLSRGHEAPAPPSDPEEALAVGHAEVTATVAPKLQLPPTLVSAAKVAEAGGAAGLPVGLVVEAVNKGLETQAPQCIENTLEVQRT